MLPSIPSILFVLVQVATMALIFMTGPPFPSTPAWLALEGLGIAIGLSAVWTMRKSRLNVFPEALPGGQLISDGLYRFIRHPMYLAVLLVTIALVLEKPDLWRGGLWAVLFIDLVLKLRYEEQHLTKTFAGYGDYRARTKRLIPFIF